MFSLLRPLLMPRFNYTNIIFANQASLLNTETADLTTNEVISLIAQVPTSQPFSGLFRPSYFVVLSVTMLFGPQRIQSLVGFAQQFFGFINKLGPPIELIFPHLL